MWNYNTTYLCHHGILGQKWGIRRYQNYDGSYTQAGVKRYNKSKEKYESDKQKYKDLRKGNSSDTEKTNARINMNASKRRMNKDYKHLKEDMRADKGKKLYSEGYRIRGKRAVIKTLKYAGAIPIAAVAIAKFNGGRIPLGTSGVNIQMPNGLTNALNKHANVIGAAGAATIGAAIASDILTYNKDQNLRSYYSHTSKY